MVQLISHKICIPLHSSVSDKAKERILNVDLPFLPNCIEFFHRF